MNSVDIQIIKDYANSCDNVRKLKKQLTDAEIKKLLEKYSSELIIEQLAKMENYKPLAQKYTSVYLTLLKWFKLDEQKGYIAPNPQKKHYADDKKNFLKNHPIGSSLTIRNKNYKVVNEDFLYNEDEGTSLPIIHILRSFKWKVSKWQLSN